MKDWKLVVAFDTDDTLLIPNVAFKNKEILEYKVGAKHIDNVNAYKWFQNNWCHMIVWSWTWLDWANKWAKEFWLNPDEIREKWMWYDVDIAIDDMNVDLATVNMKVKRVNNSISRKEWNNIKHL